MKQIFYYNLNLNEIENDTLSPINFRKFRFECCEESASQKVQNGGKKSYEDLVSEEQTGSIAANFKYCCSIQSARVASGSRIEYKDSTTSTSRNFANGKWIKQRKTFAEIIGVSSFGQRIDIRPGQVYFHHCRLR